MPEDLRWDCADCHMDTFTEYYMVHDELWTRAGADEELLCIGCLESRLGRELTYTDFTDAPVNYIGNGWSKSPRLLERLTNIG